MIYTVAVNQSTGFCKLDNSVRSRVKKQSFGGVRPTPATLLKRRL